MDLSFVIPVRNEESHIAATIGSIRAAVAKPGLQRGRVFSHEVIVVDNGSTDRTVSICRGMGVRLQQDLAATIGALRNSGARLATGSVLIFLDADVTLHPDWAVRFPEVFDMLEEARMTISGSKVLPADSDTYLSKVWLGSGGRAPTYMNSAHLVVHRDFFRRLGGFDESLVSGEDSDLSRRAVQCGGVVRPMPGLKAIHHGSPRSLAEFFRRERWHGRGDFQAWRLLRQSRPSHLALANLASFVAAAVGAGFVSPWSLLGYPAFLLFLSGAAACHRTGCRLEKRAAPLTLLYTAYITARSLSLVDHLTGFRPRRWR